MKPYPLFSCFNFEFHRVEWYCLLFSCSPWYGSFSTFWNTYPDVDVISPAKSASFYTFTSSWSYLLLSDGHSASFPCIDLPYLQRGLYANSGKEHKTFYSFSVRYSFYFFARLFLAVSLFHCKRCQRQSPLLYVGVLTWE